jgi:hypothetical protein
MPVIDSVLESELHRAIAAKVQIMGGFVHAMGGKADPVHLAVSVPPKLAPANSSVT